MEISYNQKINFDEYDSKSYLLHYANKTIAQKNLTLLKQEFCNIVVLQHRVEAKPEELKSLYNQCWYLLKMFDRCEARITLPWNDKVLSTDHIGFAGERKSRKQRNLIQFILFQNS